MLSCGGATTSSSRRRLLNDHITHDLHADLTVASGGAGSRRLIIDAPIRPIYGLATRHWPLRMSTSTGVEWSRKWETTRMKPKTLLSGVVALVVALI